MFQSASEMLANLKAAMLYVEMRLHDANELRKDLLASAGNLGYCRVFKGQVEGKVRVEHDGKVVACHPIQALAYILATFW